MNLVEELMVMGRRPTGTSPKPRLARTFVASTVIAAITFGATACGSDEEPSSQRTTTGPTSRQTGPTGGQTTSPPPTGQSSTAIPTPATEYLSDIAPLTSAYGVDSGSAEVNGQNYSRSISLHADKASIPTSDAEYHLGRHWKVLKSTVGLRDDSPTGSALTFEVFADGRPLYKETASIGETREVNLDITGVLRLKLVVTYASSVDVDTYCYGVWGDALLAT